MIAPQLLDTLHLSYFLMLKKKGLTLEVVSPVLVTSAGADMRQQIQGQHVRSLKLALIKTTVYEKGESLSVQS